MSEIIITIVSLAALAFGIARIFKWYNSAKVAGEKSNQVEDIQQGRTDRTQSRQQGRTARLLARLKKRMRSYDNGK